jgi:hypothetical protein
MSTQPLPTLAPEAEHSLRFPIGTFQRPATRTPASRLAALGTLATLPADLRYAVAGLTDAQLDTPYRTGGWTVRQVVHHLADSHMNAFIRLRLALTEHWPTIKPYDEAAWAQLPDSTAPVEWSLALLESLHARWLLMVANFAEDDPRWQRGFRHPESGPTTVELTTFTYAWHSAHHLAHITSLRQREGW